MLDKSLKRYYNLLVREILTFGMSESQSPQGGEKNG